MKRSQINHRGKMRATLLLILMVILSGPNVFPAEIFQDDTPLRTRVSLSCIQLPNHQMLVQAKIRARVEKKYVGVANADIEIYNLMDSTKVLLGKETSDQDGLIELIVKAKDQLQIRADGYYGLYVSYGGDENHQSSDDELLFKPAFLELKAAELDSVRTITIKVYDENGVGLPLEGTEVALQVPRLFSDLTIATDAIDEDGKVVLAFPDDLPGGENGELLITAKVEDTDDYASIQSQIQSNWGVPTSTLQPNHTRELWTPNAPLWMVFTFAFLMILVWVHFLIIIYKLYLIHQEGKSLGQ